jgi:hypothetical protein
MTRKQRVVSPSLSSRAESQRRLLWLICLGGFALVALAAFRSAPQISSLLLEADNDDQMRLVQVRDWLAGQGWFDTRQYRVLPPDGISMHWSRYVDAGLAAVLTVAGWLLPSTQAELATVILWPSLLACLMVLVLTHGTARLMGTASALGALAVFLGWGKLGGEFAPPRIDHHNLQMLCGAAIFYLSVVPGRAHMLGALAGGVTALSLAIGLEMLPFLATVWGLMALRHAFGQAKAGDWLLGFAACFTVAAPLLMAGQTAAANWSTGYCDVLAPPVLALGAVGVVATVTPVLAGRMLTGPLSRLPAMIASLPGWAFGWPGRFWATAWPGPMRRPRRTWFASSRPMWSKDFRPGSFLARTPSFSRGCCCPPRPVDPGGAGGLHAAAPAGPGPGHGPGPGLRRRRGRPAVRVPADPRRQPDDPGGAAAGRVPRPRLHPDSPDKPRTPSRRHRPCPCHADRRRKGRGLGASATGCGGLHRDCLCPAFGLPNGRGGGRDCQPAPSVIFSSLNLGPTILTYTPHSVTSAGYHRSPEAFWNGVGAFLSPAQLRQALQASGAQYLVLCPNGRLEHTTPVMQSLLHDPLPAFLSEATGGRQEVRVFRVDPAALSETLLPETALSGGAP